MDVPASILGPALIGIAGVVAAAGRLLWAALSKKIEATETASAERHKACDERALRLEAEIREMWLFQRDRLSEIASRALRREERLAQLLNTEQAVDLDETALIPRAHNPSEYRRASGSHG